MQPGNIILLNGASSSGKTSVLKALQQIFPDPYLNAGLDKFLWMLPSRYLDRPLWDDVLGLAVEAGNTGQRLVSGMHQAIAALSISGNNVLADHVLVEPEWSKDCARRFDGLPVYLVGLRCPLEILEEREKARRDRTLGQARAQFERAHAHGVYDLEVDTSLLDPQQSAAKIKAYIDSGARPYALPRLKDRLDLLNTTD